MAFVFLILVFFIDQRGVSDKHCLLSFFSLSQQCMRYMRLFLPQQCMRYMRLFLSQQGLRYMRLFLSQQCMRYMRLFLSQQCMRYMRLFLSQQCMRYMRLFLSQQCMRYMRLFLSKGWKGKSKSSHDLANDPKLSAVPALEMEEELVLQPEKRDLETQVGYTPVIPFISSRNFWNRARK